MRTENQIRVYSLTLSVIIFFFIFGCVNQNREAVLQADLKASAEYKCTDGTIIKADFYSLHDGSMNFVRLNLPEGETYTLPQLISASGARYTDDFRIRFWVKGDTMSLQKMDNRGEWGPAIWFIPMISLSLPET